MYHNIGQNIQYIIFTINYIFSVGFFLRLNSKQHETNYFK